MRSAGAIGVMVLTALALPAWGETGWGGAVSGTTDYVVRGISESSGDPALQLDLHYNWPTGWYVGAFGSSLGANHDDEPDVQINAYAGRAWALGASSSVAVALGRYWYAGGSGSGDYNYDELSAALTIADTLTAAIVWLPDRSSYAAGRAYADRGALSYELSSRLPIGRHGSGSLGGGYYDVHGVTPSGYWFWSAGLGAEFGAFDLDLTYFSTNGSAKSLFESDAAGQRWAATVSWRF